MRVGVLASGTGTNLQTLLDQVHRRDGIDVVAVASEKPTAPALDRAREAGVPVAVFPTGDFHGRTERDLAVGGWLAERGVELVVLAGYMQLLSPAFVKRFRGRIINVHPALLPAFPGLHAVQQALDYGVKVFGVTVHFVDEGMDSGPVILQRAVEIPTASSVDEVMTQLRPLEHELLPQAVRLIASGSVRLGPDNPRRVMIDR